RVAGLGPRLGLNHFVERSVIPKHAASFLLFFFPVIRLTSVLPRAPHAMADRPTLATAPWGQAGLAQTSQHGRAHRSTITSRTHSRPIRQDSLSSRLSAPSMSPVFFTTPTYTSGGLGANAVLLSDVNGDGNLDLVVANGYSDDTRTNGSVSVLLGNGDGTFQQAVSYGSGGIDAVSVTIGDVNGDGKLDLAVANQCVDVACANGSVAVLL